MYSVNGTYCFIIVTAASTLKCNKVALDKRQRSDKVKEKSQRCALAGHSVPGVAQLVINKS